MNAATFFAAFAFQKDQQDKWLFRSLLFNGLQTPIVILAFFIPAFMFVGTLWMITLPMAMINSLKILPKMSRGIKEEDRNFVELTC